MIDNIKQYAQFLYHQRVLGFQISEAPSMDQEGLRYFYERLQLCSSYLEYGCGGSTIAAAKEGKPYTSIESDPYYLTAVKNKIESLGYPAGHMIHVDIGLTTGWGYPLIKKPTSTRIARWRRYAELPWSLNLRPDLVLIDGRFRVLCALTCIRHQSDFQILVDDYEGRDHYRTIEHFAQLDSMKGRLAVFKPKRFEQSELLAAIERSVLDYR